MMRRTRSRSSGRCRLIIGTCLLAMGCGVLQVRAESVDISIPDQREFFEKQVRPLLATHCYECHSAQAEKIQAGLRVDSREAMTTGGDSGPALTPGAADKSLLIAAVRYESFEMPPRGRLSDDQVRVLEQWVEAGAWWPPEDSLNSTLSVKTFDWERRRNEHWSWQPVTSPLPPMPTDVTWSKQPLDCFIRDRMERDDVRPAPPADPYRLLRRIYFDLIGLPPNAAQVKEFVSEPSDIAYEKLVDRLLMSPRFGEKWARHWLDLVRYAETCGHEFDFPIPFAADYRDYVIRAFNADVPFDQWVREHIAGDLLETPRLDAHTGTNESILGTGFWFFGEAVHAPTDVRGDEVVRMENQLDVFGKTFLGLTIGCARCHDHKFDAIPTTDYYALAGFLQSSRRQEAFLDPHGQISRRSAELAEQRAAGDRLLDSVLRSHPPAAEQLGDYLMAASSQERAPQREIAAAAELDSVLLARFAAALQHEELDSASHPLHAWHVLASETDPGTFAERRQQLAAQLTAQQRAYETQMESLIPFADFRRQDFDDWFVTGWAFGDGPTRRGQWEGPGTEPQLMPAAAHSGRWGKRLQGVLRSPTFTLQHDHIHYRMRAKDTQVRLIVDGYVMDVFADLLFADNTLETIDTEGHDRWVTQHRDLNHYLGHRAHLEIIDHGDGYAAVQGIYFSNGEAPPEPPHPLNLQLAEDASILTTADLAAAYARYLQERTPDRDFGGDDTGITLWNWLLSGRMIEPPVAWPAVAERVSDLDAAFPIPSRVAAMADGSGEDEYVHIRGSHRNLGNSVPRRLPVALAGERPISIPHGSGRLALADRLVARDNPLLARVIVNRLWHHLLGQGIVPTVDDFGAMGQPPSHPELLDWLAMDFMDHGWSLKRTIRQIVLSQTYQQSSRPKNSEPVSIATDQEHWQVASVKRLTAEAIRDTMLAISGRLDTRLGGPSVPVHLTPFMTGRGRPESGPLDGEGRRSIYIRIQRNFLSPLMLTFDMPAPFSSMGRRSSSNVPAQSLALMNDPFVWQQAQTWAKRLLEVAPHHDERITLMFMAAFGRPPQLTEQREILAFIERQSQLLQVSTDSVEVWTDVCHAMWNAKEFLYVF